MKKQTFQPLPEPLPEPLLLEPREAARALRISERSLQDLKSAGLVPFVRLGPGGRLVRYSPDALRKWIQEQESGNGSK